jgi:polysaccharide export outer membrane protein
MIDKEGKINFPGLGSIRVSGYTQSELENELKVSLRKYLKSDPVVTVRLMNFRISVMGEVNRPGPIPAGRDHMNVLEALALAGDMSINGKRDDVQILREMPDGTIKRVRLDISKADVMMSPYFYLKQNDIIYVAPNSNRKYGATDAGIWLTALSTLMSISIFAIYLMDKLK